MKKILTLIFFAILVYTPLQSEIEQITIRWTAQICQGTCTQLLERELKKIQGINTISIDQKSGQAILTWKQNIPFQFTSINTAMHMVSLSIREIRIKVKGMIKHTKDTFYIISQGDNTRFDLINPIPQTPNGQTKKYNAAEYNASARKISPALQQQLLNGETQNQMATIQGPFFMPEQMIVPTRIVVDQLNFANPDQKNPK